MIIPRYRSDYEGEFVVVETKISDSQNQQHREWIPNAIQNHHISGRAAVIGSDIDQSRFDYRRLQRHRGGLLGKKRLQTYGSGNLWQTMKFDFFAETDYSILSKMIEKNYHDQCTVYSTSGNCLRFPGRLYLIPYLPVLDPIAVSVYLASFDQHQEIFLLGCHIETPARSKNWIDHVSSVMKAYSGTRYFLIGRPTKMPEQWTALSNVTCMDYRDWVSYCDV